MITGRMDPVFDNARFSPRFSFTIDGVPVVWTSDHVISATFRDPESDSVMLSAKSTDGSGRVTKPADGIVALNFANLTALGQGTWELVVMLSDANGKIDGILIKLPIKTGGV